MGRATREWEMNLGLGNALSSFPAIVSHLNVPSSGAIQKKINKLRTGIAFCHRRKSVGRKRLQGIPSHIISLGIPPHLLSTPSRGHHVRRPVLRHLG
jgi:hypothetical protein